MPGTKLVLLAVTQASAGGVLQTLIGVSGAGGVATFLATPSLGTSEFVASAGGVQSNAIQLTAGT